MSKQRIESQQRQEKSFPPLLFLILNSVVSNRPYAEPMSYLLLCLFFLSLFLRLCVAILWPFFFLPFGIAVDIFKN